jgi:hypothetical protein
MTYRSLVASLLFALTAGCGSSGSSASGPPPAPLLGAQVDRVGRPGVSTLLLAPFGPASTRAAAQDAYNAASDPATWVGLFQPSLQSTLAVWDGIDASCGNQLLAAGGAASTATYQSLARLLADDRLLLRTDQASCAYLGLELAAAGLGSATTCGGRRPDEDAVDRTYSLLIIGQVNGVVDGVGVPVDTSSSAFPFLGAPH